MIPEARKEFSPALQKFIHKAKMSKSELLPYGDVQLEKGWHPFSLRIWSSDALFKVKTPGADAFVRITMSDLN